jgi:hypothetical protein
VIKNNAFALRFGLTHWWWPDKMWYNYMILTIKRNDDAARGHLEL